jgi:hypothetical protein
MGSAPSSGIASGGASINLSGEVYGEAFVDWELKGYWDPNNVESYAGTGITYFNLVTGENNLELKNGISLTSGLHGLKSFLCDGTDDYIGAISSAYGSSFRVGLGQKWSVCVWVKMGNGSFSTIDDGSVGRGNPIVSFGNLYEEGYEIIEKPMGGGSTPEWGTFIHGIHGSTDRQIDYFGKIPNKTGTWYFVSADQVSEGDETLRDKVEVSINGAYTEQFDHEAAFTNPGAATDMNIGFAWGQYSSTVNSGYAPEDFQFGEIMVYSGSIGNARIKQNYLATRDKYLFDEDFPSKL